MRGIAKVLNVLVVFSLFFSPIAPVFAQEDSGTAPVIQVDPSPSPESQSTETPTSNVDDTTSGSLEGEVTLPDVFDTPSVETTDTPTEESEAIVSDETEADSDSDSDLEEPDSLLSGNDPPTTQAPTLFSYQSIQPQVDKNSGALTQRIKLDIPPGRKGLQPDVTLEYNSQKLQDDSIVGYGWSINIPYIERMNKRGTNNLYTDNYFYSSISGELATTSATTTPGLYYARVDDGSRIQFNYSTSTNSWTVYDKNGTRYQYGVASSTQQYDANGDSTKVYRWMLQEVRDLNDNYIEYSYSRDQNQLYPSMITYTGSGSTDGPLAVVFSLASSTVPNTTYKAAFQISTNKQVSAITASVSSSTVRTYSLTYGVGANGYRPVLTCVQQTGTDSSGAQLSLPPISFSYASSTVGWTFSNGFGYPLTSQAYIAIPTTGNGKNDQALFRYDVSSNKQGNVNQNYIGTVPEVWGGSSLNPVGIEEGTRFFDVNGDGIPDLVRGHQNAIGGNVTRILINTSTSTGSYNSWSQIATTSVQGTIPYFAYGTNPAYTGGLLGNLNGDSSTDYAMSESDIGSSVSYYGNGQGWNSTSDFVPVKGMPNGFGSNLGYNSQLIDINGDGLDDWSWTDTFGTYFCLNKGTSWDSGCTSPWNLATSTLYFTGAQYKDRGMRFMDVNGDGLPDFIRAYNAPIIQPGNPGEQAVAYQLFLNTGSGWATTTVSSWGPAITTTDQYGGVQSFSEMADWNGDGTPDAYQYYNQASKQDVLTKITYPRGGYTDVTYKMTPQDVAKNPTLPTPMLVVTRLVTNDNNAHSAQYDYSYNGGKLYLSNGLIDRKFAGFSSITETGPLASTITYFSQGDVASTSVGERTDGFAQIQRPYREDISNLSGTLLKRTFYKWDGTDLSNRWLLTLGYQLVQDFDSTGSTHRDHAVEYTYATTTGNVTQTTDRGEVVGSSDGTYSDTGADTRITSYTYATNASTTLDVVSSVTVTDSGATKYKETKYKYDNLAFGSATTTNPTEIDTWISGGTYATTTKLYTSYGMVSSTTDPLGNTTKYVYDSLNLYPATTTNALDDSTKFAYDYATGRVATTTDPNNYINVVVFDPVGRPSKIKQSDITTPTTLNIKQTVVYVDNVSPSYTLTTNYLSAASSTQAYTYFDGVGRVIQTRTQAPTAGVYIVNDKVYNNSSVLSQESLPYFSSGASSTSATTTSALFQTYTYDALQRITVSQNAVATTTSTYGAWKTTVRDPNGYDTEYTYDAWKNLVAVVDPLSANFPTSGIAGYWKLDESSGNAVDSSGYGNTLTNTGTTTYATGLINNAADFGTTSASKMLSIGSALGIDGGASSYSLWVKIRTEPSNSGYGLFALDNLNSKVRFQLGYSDSSGVKHLTFGRATPGNGASDVVMDTVVPALGTTTWHHLLMTYDGTTLKAYLDGVVQATSSASGNGTINVGSFTELGCIGDNNTCNSVNSSNVYMDEVGVWNRALTTQEIEALYNSGAGKAWGTTGAQTSYTYDIKNNLTNITDALGNTRSFTYDGLDRRLTAQDLHAASDGGYGTWTYTYDGINLTKIVDAKSQTITYGYDALNRMRTENYSGTSGNELVYAYDSGTGNIGYLTNASTTNTKILYTYNSLSLPKTETATINGTSTPFKTTYTYDWQGNITNITYPDNSQVQYNYSALGYLDSVQAKESNAAYRSIVSRFDYAPTRDFSTIVYANGATTTNTYNSSELYRLSNKTTAVSTSSPLQNISYVYDPTGNITTITDISSTSANRRVAYTYDRLNRLTFASSTAYAPTSYVASSSVLNYVVVGGGGGGAGVGGSFTEQSGGGGGGQVTIGTTTILATDSYTVTIGAQGTRGAAGENDGSAGGTSIFSSLATSTGGAGGTHGTSGSVGGNGGISGSGNTGGSGANGGAGGGGGASTAGQNGNGGTSVGGNGGVGTVSNISGSNLTYGSGGGGGGFNAGGTASSGGGAGGTNDAGSAAATNRGGGGGGAAMASGGAAARGGHGAAGVVVISYPTGALTATGGATSTSAGKMIHTFTTSGTFTISAINSTTTLYTYPTHYQTTYQYNVIGNMTNKADAVDGSNVAYSYSTSTMANPHAPTTIGGVTLTYDNNGNLTQHGNKTFTWDYDNKITQIATGTATSTYTYNASRVRSSITENGVFTVFPNKYFSTTVGSPATSSTATSTKYIYAPSVRGEILLATVENVSTAPTSTPTATTTRYIFTDHLGSTNVVTNSSGTVIETLDYHPYGKARIDTVVGNYINGEKYKYAGTQYDSTTNLDYAQQRYYDQSRGQFLSQDPVHLIIGNPSQVKAVTGRDQQTYLMDPQLLNSYSYARGNPIVNKDPTGLWTIGFNVGVTAELGSGFFGGGTLNTGIYLIADNQTGKISFARADTVGGAAGVQGGGNLAYPEPVPENGGVLGATISVGVSGTYSKDVNKPEDLNGTSKNKSVSALVASFQVSESPNGSKSYTVGGGVKPVGSVSNYSTRTQVKSSVSVGTVPSFANPLAAFVYYISQTGSKDKGK